MLAVFFEFGKWQSVEIMLHPMPQQWQSLEVALPPMSQHIDVKAWWKTEIFRIRNEYGITAMPLIIRERL